MGLKYASFNFNRTRSPILVTGRVTDITKHYCKHSLRSRLYIKIVSIKYLKSILPAIRIFMHGSKMYLVKASFLNKCEYKASFYKIWLQL